MIEDKQVALDLTGFVPDDHHRILLEGVCDCKFDPYDDGDTEESWHYKRTCLHCGHTWFGLHCPHDRVQNPCPGCGVRPSQE